MMLAILAVAVLGACGTSDAPTTPASPSPPPGEAAGPALPSIEAGWTEPDPGATPLVIAPDRIALGDGAPILRLEAGRIAARDLSGGESGFLVPRVRDAVRARRPTSTSITIAADPSVPYGTLARVVYSAAQADVTTLHFAIRVGGAERVIPVELPSGSDLVLHDVAASAHALADVLAGGAVTDEGTPPPGPEPPVRLEPPSEPPRGPQPVDREARLSLTLALTAGGIVVSGSGGKLTPGCETATSGQVLTVPNAAAGPDIPTLATCLDRVHAAFPSEQTVIISPDPDVRFGEVARVIVAARGTEAAPLFPRTVLAATIR